MGKRNVTFVSVRNIRNCAELRPKWIVTFVIERNIRNDELKNVTSEIYSIYNTMVTWTVHSLRVRGKMRHLAKKRFVTAMHRDAMPGKSAR